MSKVLTLKQITNYIGGVFEDELILHDVCVSGEIFEFRVSGSNTFIVLKEDDAVLECYKYGRLEHYQNGARVVVRGRVKYYPKGGKVSLIIAEIKYTGEGQYFADFEKLKEKLSGEGLFCNKNCLPVFIKNVAIITSNDGAVIHDFMSVIKESHAYIGTEVYNVSVQGDSAKSEIVSMIAKINGKSNNIKGLNPEEERVKLINSGSSSADVIVIARGGGSYQDLLPFNSEEIARAVFASNIPIISAVGHETDYTLCDACSVYRAPTPSLAAEKIAKINQSWFDTLYGLLIKSRELIFGKLIQGQNRVSMLTRKLAFKNEFALQKIENRITAALREINVLAEKKIARNRAMVEQKVVQLYSSMQRLYSVNEKLFVGVAGKLDALSPLKLIAGGYAKVSSEGKAVKSTREISKDQILRIVLADGLITAKVMQIESKAISAEDKS